MPEKIIFIVGPTAVGKSEIACSLAKHITGEIISCDSMQVYKELQIVTSKPSGGTFKEIPHHLVDIISVREEFDVARFNALALEALSAIQARGHIPLIVGGSGLYMQILLDGIFPETPKSEEIRTELKEQAAVHGNEYLYRKLQKVDPAAALKIHSNDLRRVIRALEVHMLRREPISKLHKERNGIWGQYDIRMIGLTLAREALYQRIDRRVEAMFAQGAVEEIRALEQVPLGLTAERLIGLKEIRGFLKGLYDENHTKELMKLNTRRYAKRQLTWFRKEKRLQWITILENDTVEEIVKKIMNCIDCA